MDIYGLQYYTGEITLQHSSKTLNIMVYIGCVDAHFQCCHHDYQSGMPIIINQGLYAHMCCSMLATCKVF